ncbi:M61 family metallopeptidase [Aquirufa regiilacus]|uniref:PDZ domain-containing protein n=1 Tax=Aquirufa regiilacus TaxID=3024868 RepID=A0ABU3TQ54_9BACT|nr:MULTISPECIES: PDZ domain-containing protein [unclassified Aquirufa]MDT8887328.1 PDZ domain-containing protein [Aquirufa sp. LEPPI-3A]MDU0807998.1 PDZ domain-containing protein [Aquirufa sp. LEOWEIH-7C]
MYLKRLGLLGLLFLGFNLSAAPIKHLIQMPNPHSHYFDVTSTLDVSKEHGKFIDLKMAAWNPGSYLIREFARNVEQVSAQSGNANLAISKVSKNTWRVALQPGIKTVQVHYQVYANELSVRTSFLDDVHGYINPASVLMYVAKWAKQPQELSIVPHKDFKRVSTALKNVGGFNYIAKDLDELIDSPIEIGNQQVWNFKVNKIPHQIAFFGQAKVDSVKFIADVKKMAETAQGVVGQHPCDHYVFIIHNIQRGTGGLEHLYSTTCSVSRTSYETPGGYQGVLNLLAHEYFHLWNVKRIRPIALGPFDYEQENYTHNLWFSEGITSYYADVINLRTKMVAPEAYLVDLAKEIAGVENTPGAHIESAAASSWDAWIKYYRPNENSRNSTVSYYDKGALLGGLLNMWIIQNTNGAKCLDDVFQLLYQNYYLKQGRGFTDAELENAFSSVAGTSATGFFKDYVYGVKTPDYAGIFNVFGYTWSDSNVGKSVPFAGFSVASNRITSIYKGGPAYDAGLNVGDEIVQVNQAEFAGLDKWMADKKIGDVASFRVKRDGLARTFELTIAQTPMKAFVIQSVESPNATQLALRKKWLSL